MHFDSCLADKQLHRRGCLSFLVTMFAVLDTAFDSFGKEDFEDRIYRAYSESIQTQSCLPLVKQELQCKIQYDRLSRGEPELILEEEPPKTYELTEEEIRKKDIRLQQNRESAFRSRNRSKAKEEKLKKNVDDLFNMQRELARELRKLKEEKRLTLAKLRAHVNVCGKRGKKDKLKHELLLHTE